MKGYAGLTLTVKAIKWIGLTGNVIPRSWSQWITYGNGKPNPVAIMILAELCYWYRPMEDTDSKGKVICWRRKFKADILQKSYEDLADCLGFTVRQVADNCRWLKGKGLIKLETRDTLFGRNRLFIDLCPSEIDRISSSLPGDDENYGYVSTYPSNTVERSSYTETTSTEELINLDLKHKDKQVVGRSGDPTIALPDFLISDSENFPESDEEVKTQSSLSNKNPDTAKPVNEIKTTPHSPPSPRAKVKRIDRDVEMQIEVKVRKPPQATKIIFKENDFGWLQMPSTKVFKLARRVATRRLQNQMAPLFSNIKWSKNDRGELILVNAKDDSRIEPEAFSVSEWLDLASLRDQLLEKELLSQDDFNELLEAIFIDSVKWCKKMGTIALKTIEPENAIANLFAQTDRNLLANIRGN